MGCGASVNRFVLEDVVIGERPVGVQRSVDIGNGVFRKAGFENGLVGVPPEAPHVKTAWDVVAERAKTHPKVNCIGVRRFQELPSQKPLDGGEKKSGEWKEYVWTPFEEFHKLAVIFGKGLLETFPDLAVGAHVGVYGPSILPLLIAQYGSMSQALVYTPMYDTWSGEILQHVIVHADLEVVIVAQTQLPEITNALLAMPSKVRGCVVLPQTEIQEGYVTELAKCPSPDEIDAGVREKVPVFSYQMIMDKGKESAKPVRPPEPEADAVIMYTSGSSGLPKGVQLSHAGFVGVATGLREATKDGMAPGRVVACFLPLGHIYPTAVLLASFLGCCTTGLYHGVPAELVDDLQAMQPEVLPGVPRVYQGIYNKVLDSFKGRNCVVQRVLDNAVKKQTANYRAGRPRDSGLDNKVFSKIQGKLGGKLKYLTTGASPILPALQEWMKVCFNAQMSEGYGLTESFGCAMVQESSWNTTGDVGAPLCCTEIKLHDVPDFGYSSKGDPPRGELCVRGVNLMRGYYKDPEKTAEEIKDGWLHTGDIAKRNTDGTFSIIDRISNVFKLGRAVPGVEGAVLIAPEVIENQIAMCSLVNQVWIYGSTNYPHLVAVVVPDAKQLLAKAGSSRQFQQEGWKEEVAKICAAEETKAWIMQEVRALVQDKKIKEWESPNRIHLEGRAYNDLGIGFSIENGLLTPTFKVRRGILKKKYDDVLAEMYKLDGVEWKK
jgi:long-chain acyl-CoA synthetase